MGDVALAYWRRCTDCAEGCCMTPLTLVSHALCPYVQRAAIVLAEKGVSFERRWVELDRKPDWFLAISPLGKTPVLLAGDVPVFESAVICEYLEDTLAPALHPAEPLRRAVERGWMEFGSAVLNTIWSFYTAPDEAALEGRRAALRAQFEQVEAALDHGGPWFAGVRPRVPLFRRVRVAGRAEPVRRAAARAALARGTGVAPLRARGRAAGLRPAAHAVPARARLGAVPADRGYLADLTFRRHACSSGSV
jgi:glutathione S-transferase